MRLSSRQPAAIVDANAQARRPLFPFRRRNERRLAWQVAEISSVDTITFRMKQADKLFPQANAAGERLWAGRERGPTSAGADRGRLPGHWLPSSVSWTHLCRASLPPAHARRVEHGHRGTLHLIDALEPSQHARQDGPRRLLHRNTISMRFLFCCEVAQLSVVVFDSDTGGQRGRLTFRSTREAHSSAFRALTCSAA